MQSNKSSAPKLVLAGLLLAFVTACEQEPLGYDELGRGELSIHEIVLEPDTLDFFSDQIELGEAATLIGGRDTLTEARILIAIEGLDSIAAFDSVKLLLRLYEPDEVHQQSVTFNVYPVEADWEEDGCTWVLADKYTKWAEPGAVFDSTDLLAEIVLGDRDTTELRLNPERLDDYRQGMIFVPQNEGFLYLGSDERESYAPLILGFDGEDTTTFTSAAGADYYATLKDATILRPYEAHSTDPLLGAGLAWRVFMHFPLDTLPEDIDITSAHLRLGYENLFSPESTLDFVTYRLTDAYEERFSELSSAIAGRDSIAVTEDSVSISLGWVVQLWVDEPDSNFGVFLMHSSFNTAPEYSQEKNIYALGRLRGIPELVITYTDVPKSRFRGGD